MTRFNELVLSAAVALAVGGQAFGAITVAQYGFDHTSGTVAAHGGSVVNDANPGTHNLGISRGDGGTYSSDLPTNRQHTTGIGSLLTSSGAVRTGTGAAAGEGVIVNADIANAGGLTMEVWVKGGNNGLIMTVAGAYNLRGTDTGFRMFNGGGGEFVDGVADRAGWNHVAAVFANPSIPQGEADHLNTDMQLYINGVLAGTFNTTIPFDLARGLGVGDHQMFPGGGDLFNGLVYEPRYSLGVVDVEDFTIAVPEPASLMLIAAGGTLLLRRRRHG